MLRREQFESAAKVAPTAPKKTGSASETEHLLRFLTKEIPLAPNPTEELGRVKGRKKKSKKEKRYPPKKAILR